MKKTMTIVAIFLSVYSYSQEVIGDYSLTYFKNKTYEVSASKPKASGKYSFYFDVYSRDKLIDKVSLIFESKELTEFKEIFQQAKEKYVSWSQTAKAKQVTKLDKEMEDYSLKLGAAFLYGSKWRFDFNVTLLFRAKIIDDKMHLIVQNKYKLTSSSNKYIDCDGFYLVFSSAKEIDVFLNQFDPVKVNEHFSRKGNTEELFQ